MAGLCPNVRQSVYEKYRNKDTPGPIYGVEQAVGRQNVSRRPSAPSFSFGHAPRDRTSRSGDAPGPGMYDTPRTATGYEAVSVRRSAPVAVFGKSPRDRAATVQTPGPQYEVPDTFGRSRPRSADSRRRNAPAYSMGRDRKDKLLSTAATASVPGPGAYGVIESIGDQPVSNRPSSARTRFGKSSRDGPSQDATRSIPGPGAYTVDGGIGKQVVSARTTSPAFTFRGSRPQSARSVEVPGPGSYGAPESIGRTQVFPSSPTIKFSRSPRDAAYPRSITPGPQYEVDGSIGRQALSSRHTASGTAFPKSPRFIGGPKDNTPGPSAYDSTVAGFGHQPLSSRRDAPSYTLGAR